MDWSKYSPEELQSTDKILGDISNDLQQKRDALPPFSFEPYRQIDEQANKINSYKEEIERLIDTARTRQAR